MHSYDLKHYNYNTLMNMYCSYYTKVYNRLPNRKENKINDIKTSKEQLICMIEKLITLK